MYKKKKSLVTRGVQSTYRESDAQTDPWVPPYKILNGKPEVFTLAFMKYGRDLPSWRRTVDTIEFMRKKRKWDKYVKRIYSPENAELCKRILTDIQLCELRLIENDYDRRNKERLELAAKEADYINFEFDEKFKERQDFVAAQIEERNQARLRAIRARKTRELRKIDMKQRGVNMKYRKLTPIEEMCDPLSPYNVSVARFGKNPRYGTQVLSKDCDISNTTASRTVEKILEKKIFGPILEKKPSHKKHDCSRLREEVIPFDELKARQSNVEHKEVLLNKLQVASDQDFENMEEPRIAPLFLTPRQEKDYQAVLLLQTLIRGRAVQSLMYKGRTKNQALLDEILSTVGFFKEEQDEIDLKKRHALQMLRYYHLNMKQIGLVAQVREDILGSSIAYLATEAYQEVERAAEERRAQLVVQTAERTRWRREAAESGRRQRELRRRELYDEFFRHLTRKNEITSDFYIKLIEEQVLRSIAEKEADMTTRKKADEIENQDIEDAKNRNHDVVARREMMARLLHDVYAPQITKEWHHHEYFIDKARKTAIDVVSGAAKKKYAIDSRKTNLLEPVIKRQQKSDPDKDDSSSSDTTDSYEELPDIPDVGKTKTMVRRPTIDVGDILSEKMLSKLRLQDDSLEKENIESLKKSEKSECLKKVYPLDPKLLADEEDVEEEPSSEDGLSENLLSDDGSFDSDKSSSTYQSDFMDRRLLVQDVNQPAEATTSEQSDIDSCRKKLGDMPDRIADELLDQAEVSRYQDNVRAKLVKATLRKETDDESTPTESQQEGEEYESEEDEEKMGGENAGLADDEVFLKEATQRLWVAEQPEPTSQEWIRRTAEENKIDDGGTAIETSEDEDSFFENG